MHRVKCGMVFRHKPSGKVLFVHQKTGKWGPPKGTREFKDGKLESEEDCALREVAEEIKVTVHKDILTSKISKENKFCLFVIDVDKCFDCKVDENEISEYGWFDLNNHPKPLNEIGYLAILELKKQKYCTCKTPRKRRSRYSKSPTHSVNRMKYSAYPVRPARPIQCTACPIQAKP